MFAFTYKKERNIILVLAYDFCLPVVLWHFSLWRNNIYRKPLRIVLHTEIYHPIFPVQIRFPDIEFSIYSIVLYKQNPIKSLSFNFCFAILNKQLKSNKFDAFNIDMLNTITCWEKTCYHGDYSRAFCNT